MTLQLVNEIYDKLDVLRRQHGTVIHIAIGHRVVFGHQVELEIRSTDIEICKKIFPDGPDLELNTSRHHPIFKMIGYKTQPLIILPGEGYEIYREDDNEKAIITHTGIELKIYKPTMSQIQQFAEIYQLTVDQVLNRLI